LRISLIINLLLPLYPTLANAKGRECRGILFTKEVPPEPLVAGPGEKIVTFHLWAHTREECSVEKVVPGDTTAAQLDAMLDEIRRNSCGSDYKADPEYWEEGEGQWEVEKREG
jgi:hypothetical protein